MNNEPLDYNKGSRHTQSPYYQEEPGQCDLCKTYVPQDILSFITNNLCACPSCYTASLQEPTEQTNKVNNIMNSKLYKNGPNGYALYNHKNEWRESATVRNEQLVPIEACMVGIAGALNHGKNTLADVLNTWLFKDKKQNVAFGAVPKQILRQVFPLWSVNHFHDRQLKEKVCPIYKISPRQAMTTFATDWMRNTLDKDFWIKRLELELENLYLGAGQVVVTDVRFNNEAGYILKNGGIIFRINDPRKQIPTDEESEAGILDEHVTVDIMNDGSFEDLIETVKSLRGLYHLPK